MSTAQGNPNTSSCDWLDQRIYALNGTTTPDSLELRLQLIDLSRECHRVLPDSTAYFIWLLRAEVYSLNELGRLEAAEAVLAPFFTRYFDDADDAVRASMLAWRFRFRIFRGDLLGAVAAYHQAEPYREALPLERRLHATLDAANAYLKIDEPEEAALLVGEVEARAEPGTEVAARALVLRASIHLDEGERRVRDGQEDATAVFEEALRLLRQADATFEALDLRERSAGARIEQGRALALLGRSAEAERVLTDGLRRAVDAHAEPLVIYARYRRGTFYAGKVRLDAAEDDLARAVALVEETGFREYASRIFEALGMVYEVQRHRDRARVAYERAVTEAETMQAVASLRAARQAEAALVRVALEGKKPSGLWISVLIAVALLVGLVVGFNLRMQSRRFQAPTPVRALAPPVPRSDPPDLFDRRLAYIYQVLRRPRAALPYVEDPYLEDLLRRGDLQTRAELYQAAAGLETHREGRCFDSGAANNYGTYLRRQFKRQGLAYPRSLEAWRAFFTAA